MDGHRDTSPAKAQLEALKRRCESDADLRDEEPFDSHRRLLDSAIYSTNGAPDKIAAMAETQGQLVAFMVQQSIREPHRLAEAFSKVHVCPFKRDANGNIIEPPWEDCVRDALNAHKASEPAGDDSGFEFGLPGMPPFIKAHGKAATKGILIVSVLFYLGYRAYQDKQFEKRVESRLAIVSQTQAHNNAGAVARGVKMRADVQELIDQGVDAEGKSGVPYDPAPD